MALPDAGSVLLPLTVPAFGAGVRASLEACSNRLVVPRALVVPDLAEQTTAILLFGM